MQTFLLIILSLIFSSALGQNQKIEDKIKYKATYELTWKIDSTDAESVKTETMVLFIGAKISQFSSEGKHTGDSIKAVYEDIERTPESFREMRSKIPESEFNYYVYKKQASEEVAFTEKIVKDNYRYSENLSDLEWKIFSESKKIAGFSAQKAELSFRGRNYTAWFTAEIPISEGPYKFNGLPGLIMKISDDQDYYVFKLTGFKKLTDRISVTYNPKDYLEISKERFLEIKKEYAENPFIKMESAGITMGFKPGQKEKLLKEHREEFKKKNNPIELE